MENYNELLEKAKKAYNKSVTYEGRLILESLFPELKEGEDERIRKDLIHWFRTHIYEERMPSGLNFSNEKVIAWLEKQECHIESSEKPTIDSQKLPKE